MRHEFGIAVKRAAMARSEGRCEAVGIRYGHAQGERCQRPVATGSVNYEHYPLGAHDPSPETTALGNCTAICVACNQFAANHTDKQVEQKIKNLSYDHDLHAVRMSRKAGAEADDPIPPRGRQGKKGPPIRSRPFAKGPKQKIPSRPFPRRSA